MNKRKKMKIIVNMLTGSRLVGALMVPIAINLLSIPMLLGILSILLVTDFLDGKLARKYKVQTVGGSMLDPLSDKLLAFSCLLSLLQIGSYMLVPFFMEITIGAINSYKLCKGQNVKATNIGKLKTWALSIMILLGVINVLSPDILNVLFEHLHISMPDLTVTKDVVNASVGVTVLMEAGAAVSYARRNDYKTKSRIEKIDDLRNLKEILIELFDEDKYEENKDKALIDIVKKR